jgi:Fic family protein
MLVREKNDLTQWLKFFLSAITDTADKSTATLNDILRLKAAIEKTLLPALGKRLKSGQVFFSTLFSKPLVNTRNVQEIAALSPKAANDLIAKFVELGILKEMTGFQRNRVYIFESCLNLFERGNYE